MILINVAAVVVAVAMVVIVAALVPLILEMRKTAVAMRSFITTMESDLNPALKELNETLADIRIITGGAAENVEDLQSFMRAAGDAGRGLRTISIVVSGASEALTRSSLWLTGAKVAGSFLLDRLSKKRR
jgi:uncharacterized protein YoxC